MKDKHLIGIRLLETLAALIMALIVCVVSVPSLIYIGFIHFKHKIKL